MKITIFLMKTKKENEYNDATKIYVDFIEKILEKNKFEVFKTSDLKSIKKDEIVFTISSKSFVFLKIHNPKLKIFNWFQGVVPEEIEFQNFNLVEKYLRKKIHEFFEKITLKYSFFNFFVSDEMVGHYKRKYNYKKENFTIMPCFNKKLNKDVIKKCNERYKTPYFVYAGSLAKWQCIEETLKIYKKIEEHFEGSKLGLYTKEFKKAKYYIDKYGIKNYEIEYLLGEELDQKLKNYKYGFLLRENNIVNKVSTPTKLNTYLSLGLIPIISSNIGDINRINEKNSELILNVGEELDLEKISKKIIEFEKMEINSLEVLNMCEEIFDNYYNFEVYEKEIEKKLIKNILKKIKV